MPFPRVFQRGIVPGSSEVHLPHALVGLDLVDGALAEHQPLMQHDHPAGNAAQEIHVVLDDHDRAVLDDPLQQLPSTLALALVIPRDGLIEQQQAWVLGQQHRDLQPLALAVRKRPGQLRQLPSQTHDLQGISHCRGTPIAAAQKKTHQSPVVTRGQVDVFHDRELVEDRWGLERATDAAPDDAVRSQPNQLLADEPGAAGRPAKTRDRRAA
jgi:hypothetical protein